jgi:cyclopropane fatty-acyl-phospholipid synthase-like methyltransferase
MLDRLGVAPGGRAADLGCGSGAAALRLAERRGLDVLALDFAPPFIAALEARGLQVTGSGQTLRIRRAPQLLPPNLPADTNPAG